jgi:hypothetical protein
MTLYIMYKITCSNNSLNYVYIGCTKIFSTRMKQHKHLSSGLSKKKLNKLYTTIIACGGWDNCCAFPIELYNCNTIQEAHLREFQLIKLHNSNLNHIHLFDSLDPCKITKYKYNQKYRRTHKKLNILRMRFNCACGGRYTYEHSSTHKHSLRHSKYLLTH